MRNIYAYFETCYTVNDKTFYKGTEIRRMADFLFSYGSYTDLCKEILNTKRLCDYADVLDGRAPEFILLRHDVEFSPYRAYGLGKLEEKLGIASTFFFQVTNNAYNVLSAKNKDYIKALSDMGHHIGLHFHLNGMKDLMQIEKQIQYELMLLSDYLALPIDRFSFHRPCPAVLKHTVNIPGVINAYAPKYFTYFEEGAAKPADMVKYIADSKSCWQYTAPYSYPCEQFFIDFRRVQILCHPYTWTDTGYDTLRNLQTLIEEKRTEFIDTLNCETKYVRGYLNEL